MDIVKKKHVREMTLVTLVGAMALVANLPERTLESLGIQQNLIMAVLGLIVVLALFLYVRFFFFLLYTLLAIGANLPGKWADGLGIAQGPLLATLVSMVVMSLLNYATKLLPSGLEARRRPANPEATRVLLSAIERGNPKYVRSVLSMEFDLDQAGEDGATPLMAAARRGDLELVELLLARGASPAVAGPSGRASQLALKASHTVVADRLLKAEGEEAARRNAMPDIDPGEPSTL